MIKTIWSHLANSSYFTMMLFLHHFSNIKHLLHCTLESNLILTVSRRLSSLRPLHPTWRLVEYDPSDQCIHRNKHAAGVIKTCRSSLWFVCCCTAEWWWNSKTMCSSSVWIFVRSQPFDGQNDSQRGTTSLNWNPSPQWSSSNSIHVLF